MCSSSRGDPPRRAACPRRVATLAIVSLALCGSAWAFDLRPESLTVDVGASGTVRVEDARRTITVTPVRDAANYASATVSDRTITVRGVAPTPGDDEVRFSVSDGRDSKRLKVRVRARASLSINDATVGEGAIAAFTVTATGPRSQPVTVTVSTANATATAGSDYTATSRTLTFAAGTATLTQTFTVGTLNDTVGEPTETFLVRLTNASSAAIADGEGVGTILDDDAPSNAACPPALPAGPGGLGSHVVLASNDLGMHCADQDYQIFSILPPFNVVHAQVIRRGTSGTLPALLTPENTANLGVSFMSACRSDDPAGANSFNTTSANPPGVFKSNFWEKTPNGSQTIGGLNYRPIYPGADKVINAANGQPLCSSADALAGRCVSALDLFAPLPVDIGLPVPDPNVLPSVRTDSVHQQAMPGTSNTPQRFGRFDAGLAFFNNVSFPGALPGTGRFIDGVNWFAADGIPILPVDDSGRRNAYPLMRIGASVNGANVANADIVVPVASEADCMLCHAAFGETNVVSGLSSTGIAADRPIFPRRTYANGNAWQVALSIDPSTPGQDSEKVANAAKINILRLHDARHGTRYTDAAGSPTRCLSGTEASCLDVRRKVQCAQCHYSTALDLGQSGPVDETTQGPGGRQQTRHSTMSQAMHGFHGSLTNPSTGALVFPDMPPPNDAQRGNASFVNTTLQDTCYNCHPGKVTACMRGTMTKAGAVCQDCHGQLRHVGGETWQEERRDQGLASRVAGTRVSWLNEPKCQSCHVGDAVSVNQVNTAGMIPAADGIRMLRAYLDAGNDSIAMIQAPSSRFAEDQNLYRLSKGHGGVMCKACHGPTHAEWPAPSRRDPVTGQLASPNDNVTARQLQGHEGPVLDCRVCHGSAQLPANLSGPHGMHPVADANWIDRHENLAEGSSREQCRACHGNTGLGTPLSKTPVARTFLVEGRTVSFPAGKQIGCGDCHENELN